MGSSCSYKSKSIAIQPIISIPKPKSQSQTYANGEKDPCPKIKIVWEKKEKGKTQITKNEKKTIERKYIKKMDSVSDKQKTNGHKNYLNAKTNKNYVDPKTRRIVPNLKPLASNKLYLKRVIGVDEEIETDVSMKIKGI